MATGYVEIKPATDDAPFALKASLTATGGTWPTATYSFLLIAWDDPQEQDPEQARYINNAWGVTPSAGNNCTIDGLTTGAGDNDIVTISWTAPRRRPHHYALYYQVAATFDFTNAATRLTPEGTTQGGYIPGWATSVTMTARTNFFETRSARIKTINANASYEVYGNHALYLYQGASVNAYDGDGAAGGTAHTLDGGHPDLSISTIGDGDTITKCYEGATRSTANWLQYELGLLKWESAAALNLHPTVTMSLVTDMQTTEREHVSRDYRGRSVELSYLTGDDLTGLMLQCTHAGLGLSGTSWTDTSAIAALATLHRWRRNKIPLLLTPVTGGSSASLTTLRGTITNINEWGHSHLQGNQRIEVAVEIDRTYNNSWAAPLKRYAISAVQTSPGRFTIDGDHRKDFPVDAKIYVRGSTGTTNSGFFAVSSTELDSGNTRIYVTSTPVAGMSDATLELIDVP